MWKPCACAQEYMTLTHHELPQLHTWLPFSQNKLFAIFRWNILLFVSVVSIHPFLLESGHAALDTRTMHVQLLKSGAR